VKSFSGKTALLPGITAHPTPGHTHSCYVAASESIEFWAILFTLLLQFPKPEITVAYDVDANAAAAQRKKQFASGSIPNFGSRRTFALSGVGHLRAADQGYAWVPVDYRWREL